jgi:lipoprotein signal peptidase
MNTGKDGQRRETTGNEALTMSLVMLCVGLAAGGLAAIWFPRPDRAAIAFGVAAVVGGAIGLYYDQIKTLFRRRTKR